MGYVGPSAAAMMFRGRAQWLEQARGPSAVARTDLGTWEVAAWEIAQLGSCHLGKPFGKEPNIVQWQ